MHTPSTVPAPARWLHWRPISPRQLGKETLGPYCGDGKLDEAWEECDDGVGNVVYYNGSYKLGVFFEDDEATEPGCTPSCTVAPYCGDFIIDPDFHEMCDVGPTYSPGDPCDLLCSVWPGP
jgi:cysteine-rich repeat protein